MTKTSERTSTVAAAAAAGLSYRMLDHWLRIGAVRIEDDATPGCGYRRHFTDSEVQALTEVVTIYRAAQAIVHDMTSGALWDSVRRDEERR